MLVTMLETLKTLSLYVQVDSRFAINNKCSFISYLVIWHDVKTVTFMGFTLYVIVFSTTAS